MHFWDIESLKAELRQGPLPQPESFRYVLATLVLFGLATIPMDAPSASGAFYGFLGIAITVVGTTLAYRANGGHAGTDFAARYFAVCWVQGIRFIALMIPVFLIIAIALLALGLYQKGRSSVWSDPLISTLSLYYYWRVCRHLREVAQPLERYDSAPAPVTT